MCSRFTTGRKGLSPEDQRLEDEFVVAFQGLPRREIAPRDSSVVLARGRGGVLRATTMRWGFERQFGVVFNARSEELAKSIWSEADRKRRCAVPMEAYYEWFGTGRRKVKYRFGSIFPEDDLWAAGVWETPAQGELAFSILTKPAPRDIAWIHDRTPALLRREEVVPYLDHQLAGIDSLGVDLRHTVDHEDGTQTLPGLE